MLPVLILYLDHEYQVTYWIIQGDVKICSPATIPQAIQLLNHFEFDLIVSDPQKIAILKPSSSVTFFPFEVGGKEALGEKAPYSGLGRP